MRTKEDFEMIYQRHVRTVWNICYPYFMDPADTEDAVQETFCRLLNTQKHFRDAEHEKAWLIVTARNICRDELRRARRTEVGLDAAGQLPAPETEADEVMAALSALPDKYRTSIYLFYYEGYSSAQIAQMLRRPDASIRSDLRRGRSLLKQRLGGI